MDSQNEGKIFFKNVSPFPKIENDGLIDTEQFLLASKSIVEFVELCGITFKPVKNDIQGNIDRLWQIYETDKTKFKHLNSIVQIEKETMGENEFHPGTDSLTWLNRALTYNSIFLGFLIEDYRKSNCEESLKSLSENLNHHFSTAYDLTLKKHHGWVVRKIFSCCMMAAPSRKSLLTYLGYYELDLSPIDMKNLIVETMDQYVQLLKSNTEAVSVLLFSHGVQP